MYLKNEPTWQKDLIKDLADKYGLDKRVVREVAYYPLKFTSDVFKSDTDETPIRIRQLGSWSMRPSKGKIKNMEAMYNHIVNISDLIWKDIKKLKTKESFESKEEFINTLKELLENKKFSKIRSYFFFACSLENTMRKENVTKNK